jgi:hypothetical protein
MPALMLVCSVICMNKCVSRGTMWSRRSGALDVAGGLLSLSLLNEEGDPQWSRLLPGWLVRGFKSGSHVL